MRNLITHLPVQVYAMPDTRFVPQLTLPAGKMITDLEPAAPNAPPAGWFAITYFHPATGAATPGFIQDIAGTYATNFPAPPAPPAPVPTPPTWLQKHSTGIMIGASGTLVFVLIVLALIQIFR